MSNSRAEQQLALHGSMKAVTQIEGKGEPKIGIEEFMSVAERFGFSTKTLDAIRKAVEKEDLGGGPFLGNYYSGLKESKVQAFERVARAVFGVKYAIGVSSGTAALHSAFVAAGVGPGTEVICPAIGFYATAAAVVTAKGVPVFCDVDDSLSIDPKKIESRITNRTVAIAPTHVMGTVCDMGAIMRIARKHKLRVVEDCAQSCGGTFKGKRIGTFGDLGCFSISCYKIVGGGEGGLIVTNDKRLWERANQVAECGGLWRPDRFAPPRYDNEIFCGTNYRMSELEAAVDVVQLKRMPATVKRSNAVKMRILRELKQGARTMPEIA
ncbi:MAG TPA: aminotransferase class V-fold PLP-dependent enzyme, partial [Candidatus Hydrogenedentes bacterium]|nr:aminotransferase class V-fold PLP-dependent enzyme [Candidatus Hydrogenedentota bacterium]